MRPVVNSLSDSKYSYDRVAKERDLYRRLLELGESSEVESFMRDALRLVVELTGAERGYLELQDASAAGASEWWIAHACTDEEVEGIRESVSRGIIAEALALGETIATDSAVLDDRFRDRVSVQLNRIQAVLCAPVGGFERHGVVYLQRQGLPDGFSSDDRDDTERFARFLAPLADRLLLSRKLAGAEDAVQPLREQYDLANISGRSEALASALRDALLAAPLDVNVLLSGESGTGKSQLAGVIHANSPRREGPLVELNCAALPETLIESELFGARAGSHSEAKRDVPGKVNAAEGGTLFLDDVAELPLAAQGKLLQLLQSRTYYPLGETQPVQANVRVIAATHVDLEEAVRDRRFREDLFYRLQVIPVRVPALRERSGDIPELSGHLVRRICKRHNLGALEISAAAMQLILASSWPGNVRELENALEAACVRAAGEHAQSIAPRHVFPDEISAESADRPVEFHEATRQFQRQLLVSALEESSWNVTQTARRVGLTRSHVYNLIQAFGLRRGGS